MQRQNDGILEPFPIWDDVTTFDGKPWRGIVDVVSGGFPCQDISCAGKGAGIEGARSGLWSEMARIIGEVRPRYVFVENSPLLISRGLTTVLGDLAEMGFDAGWGVLGAQHVGAPHKRDRVWVLGHSNSHGESVVAINDEASRVSDVGDTPEEHAGEYHKRAGNGVGVEMEGELLGEARGGKSKHEPNPPDPIGTGWWSTEPAVGRVAHGVANRVDRLKAIGNGQVPIVAATAWEILTGETFQ
jgi:DNA (cytosine-5)-methyltransferase 1